MLDRECPTKCNGREKHRQYPVQRHDKVPAEFWDQAKRPARCSYCSTYYDAADGKIYGQLDGIRGPGWQSTKRSGT